MPSIASVSSLYGGLTQVLRKYGSGGTVVANTVTASEGSSIQFNLSMNNFPPSLAGFGYQLNLARGNFGSISGSDFQDFGLTTSTTIDSSGNAADVKSLNTDLVTEGTESFFAEYRTGFPDYLVLARSAEVYVADTSVNPYAPTAPSLVTIWPTSGTTANVTIYYGTNIGNPIPTGVKFNLYNYNTRTLVGSGTIPSGFYVSSNSSSVTITISASAGLASGTSYDISPYFYNSYYDGPGYANTAFTTWGQVSLVGSYIPIGASNVGVAVGSTSTTWTVPPGVSIVSGAAIGAGGGCWQNCSAGGGGATSHNAWYVTQGLVLTLYAGNSANTLLATKPAATGNYVSNGGVSAIYDARGPFTVYANGGGGCILPATTVPLSGNAPPGGGGGAGGFALAPLISAGGAGGDAKPSFQPGPAAAGAGGAYFAAPYAGGLSLGGVYAGGGSGGNGGIGYNSSSNVNAASPQVSGNGSNGTNGGNGGGGGGLGYLVSPTYYTAQSVRGAGASLIGQSQSPLNNGPGGSGTGVFSSAPLPSSVGPGPYYGGGNNGRGDGGGSIGEPRGAVRITWGQEFGRPAYPNIVADV
jgi:hypothetical protein